MDFQTLIMPVIVIGFGLFAGGMFAYRRLTAGETFSFEKFLPTMGLGALASVAVYLATGVMPSLDAIFTQIETIAPGGAPSLSVIIALLLAIYNTWSKGATTATTTTAATQAATTEQPKTSLDTTVKTITVTGPFEGHDSKVSRTGTRLIVSNTGAFQLINDAVAQNFIIASAGENALAPPSVWAFSGNLSLITWGGTLY